MNYDLDTVHRACAEQQAADTLQRLPKYKTDNSDRNYDIPNMAITKRVQKKLS